MKFSLELIKSQETVQLNLLNKLCQYAVQYTDNTAINVQKIDELLSFLQKFQEFQKYHESLNPKWSRDKKEITLEHNFNILQCSQEIECNWKLVIHKAEIQNDHLSACRQKSHISISFAAYSLAL